MPLRSIIDVEVNDARFQEFLDLFERYREALSTLPAAWGNVNGAVEATKSDFVEMMAVLAAQAEVLHRQTVEALNLSNEAARGRGLFGSMSLETGKVARNLLTATTSILKWSTVVAAVSGLVGYGGLFGITRLAQNAAEQRRTAQGVGTTIGGYQSFTAFERFVDPDSYLAGVAHLKSSAEGKSTLYAAGMSPDEWEGKDTADVGVSLLRHVRQIAQENPVNLGNALQPRHLDGLFSEESARRLGASSNEEFEHTVSLEKHYRQSSEVEDQTARSWVELDTQLHLAANNIEAAFIRGLAKLAPEIEKLSVVIVDAITAFIGSPEVKKVLKEFADYLASSDFQNDVKNFITGIGVLATSVVKAITFITSSDVLKGVLGGAVIGAFLGRGITGAVIGATAGAALMAPSAAASTGSAAASTGSAATFPATSSTTIPGFTASNDEPAVREVIRKAGEAQGLDPNQIRQAQAAFLSAFDYESGVNHAKQRPGGLDVGWAQWVGSRRRQMEQNYGDPHSLGANQKQLYSELTGSMKKYLLDAGRGTPSQALNAAHLFESGGDPGLEHTRPGHGARFRYYLDHVNDSTTEVKAPPGWSVEDGSHGRLKPSGEYANRYLRPGGIATGQKISQDEADRLNADDPNRGRHLPVMSSDYVFGKGMGRPTVNIDIDANTGSKTNISASQLSQ